MEERIETIVREKLVELGAAEVLFAVEWPTEESHGDYAVNAALAAAKALGKNPRELAEELASALRAALGADVESVTVAGPGFINISLSRDCVRKSVDEAARAAGEWGKSAANTGARIMVEYGNPNPFKEMHIGHMLSAIIGESISRLFEFSGATVLRDTFGGDVGPQVAKSLWALQKNGTTDIASPQEIGRAYIHGANAYEESAEVKGEIDALNVRLYDLVAHQAEAANFSEEDRALLYLWQKGREISMEEFNRIFRILGTHHDFQFFDSDTTAPGMELVEDALTKGVLEKSEGAIIYRGEKKGLHTLVFVTSRGTPTYETKDFGLAVLKETRAETDRIIIVTGSEQVGHFKVVLTALAEVAPLLAQKTSHVPHGLLQLTTGKMSSRKGNIITAAELIREVIELAAARNPDPLVAEQVAIGALKYMILRSAPGSNVVFDPEKSLSLEGDSGPYLQYAYVRAKSILAQKSGGGTTSTPEEPYLLERFIMRFPKVVMRAEEERAPHHVAQYLTQLAGEWNSFYAKERILGGEHEAYKLVLVEAFVQTMRHGLWLLGIPAPEKM